EGELFGEHQGLRSGDVAHADGGRHAEQRDRSAVPGEVQPLAFAATAASSIDNVPASPSMVARTPIGSVSFCSMWPNDNPDNAGTPSDAKRSRRISSRLNEF